MRAMGKRGKKPTGSKVWRVRAKTWVGRVRDEHGKRSEWTDLCTDDETIAQKRLDEWVLTGQPPTQAGKETFAQAAERLLREQDDKGVTAERRHRIRAFALPAIGHIEISRIKAPHVHSVLVGMEQKRVEVAERATKLGTAKVSAEFGLGESTVATWLRALATGGDLDDRSAEIAARAVKCGAAQVAEELGLLEPTVAKWVRARAAGKLESFAVDTVHHMRVDISRILGALVLEGAIDTNVATRVELPDDVEYDDRPFVVLNDDEIGRFFRRGFDSELMMACLLSREFAGQRTSDLLGADWGDYDLVGWTARVRRPKTDDQGSVKYRKRRKRRVTLMYERVRLVIPEHVRAPLAAWREKQRDPKTGELPTKGPLFPAQRGKNAGQRKSSRGNSWAERLREELWEEGIVRPLPGYETAVGEERRKFCALQVDTEHTRRAVFHSFRRASVTALIKAGVPVQLAMLITGHSHLPTHMGYNATDEALAIPQASLATRASNVVEKSDTTSTSQGSQISKGAEASASSAAGVGPTVTTHPSTPAESRLGREPAESTPPADLGGVRLNPGMAAMNASCLPAASMRGIDAAVAPPALAEVLAALVDVLRGSVAANAIAQVIDPGNGSISPREALPESTKSPGVSKARPEGFEPSTFGSGGHLGSRKGSDRLGWPPRETPYQSPSDPVLTQVSGQSAPPAPAAIDLLRAAAHAAVEESNWTLLSALPPLIDAEAKRAQATAPVSLEAVRTLKKGGDR